MEQSHLDPSLGFFIDIDRADAVFALLFSFAHDGSHSGEDSKSFKSALSDVFRGIKLSAPVEEKLRRIYLQQQSAPRELSQIIEEVRRDFNQNHEILIDVVRLILRLVSDEGLMSRRHCADLKQVIIGFRMSAEEYESFSSVEQQLLSFALSGAEFQRWGIGSKELSGCYETLGCSPESSDAEIRRAFRKLAMKFHPDKHVASALDAQSMKQNEQRFKRIKAAYETLSFARTNSRAA